MGACSIVWENILCRLDCSGRSIYEHSGGLRQAFIVDKHCSDYLPQKVYGVFYRQEVHYWFLFCILLMKYTNKLISMEMPRPLVNNVH